jgi:hypothetical protein
MRDDDTLLRALGDLEDPAPDRDWETRLLARCHAELERRRRLGRIVDRVAAVMAFAYLATVLAVVAQLAGRG